MLCEFRSMCHLFDVTKDLARYKTQFSDSFLLLLFKVKFTYDFNYFVLHVLSCINMHSDIYITLFKVKFGH